MANKLKNFRGKIIDKKAEKEQRKEIRSYLVMSAEDGYVKTISHPISSFGGGTFFEYYSNDPYKK